MACASFRSDELQTAILLYFMIGQVLRITYYVLLRSENSIMYNSIMYQNITHFCAVGCVRPSYVYATAPLLTNMSPPCAWRLLARSLPRRSFVPGRRRRRIDVVTADRGGGRAWATSPLVDLAAWAWTGPLSTTSRAKTTHFTRPRDQTFALPPTSAPENYHCARLPPVSDTV